MQRLPASRRRFLQALGVSAAAGFGWIPRMRAASPLFEEVPASASGIRWVHENAMSNNRYLPETMGPGVAFFDYDNDGWMDIFMVNSGAADFYKPPAPLKHALYRNNRDGTFTDVTDKAGVSGGTTFGMGCAVGDYDNDGYQDLLVTAYGGCTLYHNNGDGTFIDVTAKAGIAAAGWTTSAVWFDYDNDGKLDLFVCSFVQYSATNDVFCGDNKVGKHFYCIPRVFKPTSSLLFHNNGDGTFKEVSAGTDIGRALGKALGVVATDINGDGLLDLFVANDTVQNFLFANRGKGKWDEIGLMAEVAFSANGTPRSGMGVDAADFNGDGRQDLFVANVDQEMFSLYRNNGDEYLSDVAAPNGVAQATRLLSGWGLKFFDYDNDGLVDLFLANGHPDDMIEKYSQQVRYKEPLVLFHNDGKRLSNVTAEAGPAFQKTYPARGLAVGDYDNDGRLDVLIGNNGEAPVLLKNMAAGNHWLGLKLQGTSCNRDAIGARSPGRTATSCAAATRPAAAATSPHTIFARCSVSAPRRNSTGSKSNGRNRAAASSASRTCRSIATSPSSRAKGGSNDAVCWPKSRSRSSATGARPSNVTDHGNALYTEPHTMVAQRFVSARLPGALFEGELSRRESTTAAAVIGRVVTGDRELEDYRPLPHNLEWRLSALHWIRTGVTPFITNDVPYLANNNGRASGDAAAVLFANCVDAPSDQPIHVLEVGAGSALFARYFLDEFRALCQRHRRDFYDRLTMHVTDGSPSSVTRWSEAGMFAEHSAHVTTGVCDAETPGAVADGPLRAVFANYVLDSLPAAVLRWSIGGWQQLCARASIRGDATLPGALAGRDAEWLRKTAGASQPDELAELLPLLAILESELAFLPIDGNGPPDFERHLGTGTGQAATTVIYPYGALRCLDALIPQLHPDGFALVRDYSAGSAEPRFVGAQRFGDATAMPLNFTLIERHLQNVGVDVVRPADEGLMHTRLLTRAPIPGTRHAFLERFSAGSTPPDAWTLGTMARERVEQGLYREALDIYRQAIADDPRDWQLIAAAAQFTAATLGDPEAGLELACTALRLNPWYSPFLWNVVGECLTALGRHDEAHDCHIEAARVHPGDAETHLNLARSWVTLGDGARSLEAVAQGLAADVDAMHRHALLAVQQAAIEQLSRSGTARREAALRRQTRGAALVDRPGNA